MEGGGEGRVELSLFPIDKSEVYCTENHQLLIKFLNRLVLLLPKMSCTKKKQENSQQHHIDSICLTLLFMKALTSSLV